MRKITLIVICMLCMVVPAFGQVFINGPSQPGNQVGFVNSKEIGPNAQAGANAMSLVFAPTDVDQSQRQGQIGININDPYNKQKINQDVKVEVPRQFVEALPQMVNPQINPLITGGIGSAKDILPNIAGLKWLNEEEIVGVVSYNGWFLDRICMEDLEEFILANVDKAAAALGATRDKVRYRVLFKPKSKGVGVGGQGNLLTSYIPSPGASSAGSLAGGGAGIGGYNSSWIDNTYTVKFYKIM